MSFQHAPVTKGLMMGCALASVVIAIFDVKHYFHLQLVPHLSRHHQYWRLLAHHVVYTDSSELFVWELLLYNTGIHIERQFGSVKFASFAVLSTLVATLLEFGALLAFHRFGLNYIPAGPTALAFNLLYQYSRLVPKAYHFRVFGIPLHDKIFTYILAFQLATSQPWPTVIVAAIGILTGTIYRSDLVSLKAYRLPPWLVSLSTRFLLPLVGSTRAPRRTNRALPEERPTAAPASNASAPEGAAATPPSAPGAGTMDATRTSTGTQGALREWVDELTGRAERAPAGLRAPGEGEIAQLMAMFPNVQRDAAVAALQRSPNIEGAVERLLSSP